MKNTHCGIINFFSPLLSLVSLKFYRHFTFRILNISSEQLIVLNSNSLLNHKYIDYRNNFNLLQMGPNNLYLYYIKCYFWSYIYESKK